MIEKANAPIEGDVYDGVLLETFRSDEVSRPRVRPVDVLPRTINVEFPRDLRDKYPIGTRFRARVKVCQKHKSDGELHGPIYLRADTASIEVVSEFKPNQRLFAVLKPDSRSGRAYKYIYETIKREMSPLIGLRDEAYSAARDILKPRLSEVKRLERSGIIQKYAIARSNGICEACDTPAPFLAKNDRPYLEVHHMTALAKGGPDHPRNVAAICPNCHSRIEYGKDGEQYNDAVRQKVIATEETSFR